MTPIEWNQMPWKFYPGQEVYSGTDQKFQFVIVYEPKMGVRPWSWSYKRFPNLGQTIHMGDFTNINAAKNAVEQFRLEHSK